MSSSRETAEHIQAMGRKFGRFGHMTLPVIDVITDGRHLKADDDLDAE